MLHPSGGLIYHLRALRRGRVLWRPFHEVLHAWLADWQPHARHLLLVGPSGGYALDAEFLRGFARISVLEPDPLARLILRRRFPACRFEFSAAARVAAPDGFADVARRYPDAAVLFCNVLGQSLVGQPTGFDRAAWLARLQPALAGREWASWHDLASTRRPPNVPAPFNLARAEPLDDLLARIWRDGQLEIEDHACDGLAPAWPRVYVLWRLTSRRWHVIECLRAPSDPESGTIAAPKLPESCQHES